MERIKLQREELFLKKSKFGWRVVYPPKIDGKLNWKNLLVGGSYLNILKVLLIVGLLLFAVWSYSRDIETARQSCQQVFQLKI